MVRHIAISIISLALINTLSCKPRLPRGQNGSNAAGTQAQESPENSNRRNLLAGLSMVTQGAIQTPPGPGNPESFGITQEGAFNPSNWDQSFQTQNNSGFFDIKNGQGRKDIITWKWMFEGKPHLASYVVDRRRLKDRDLEKTFLLVRMCKLEVSEAPSPTLFNFCGITPLNESGQLAGTWTLCSNFGPECPTH